MTEHRIEVRYETIRRWATKVRCGLRRGPAARHPRADDRWHLDEMFVSIGGRPMYLWRAGDAEGEVPDLLVQPRRDKRAAMKPMRKLLRKLGRRLDQS